jgi:mRNA interferase HigB
MHVITFKRLKECWERHPETEEPLRAWFNHAKHAAWRTPIDVKRDFASVSIIANNRVVFNIKGNAYRLVVKIEYHMGKIFIRFVGTHHEYDTIDATTI